MTPLSRAGKSVRSVVVVGAGAFGGWTALALRRAGVPDVTLLDAMSAGHAGSSSGGSATRVIRLVYGAETPLYGRWTSDAIEKWREFDLEQGTGLFQQTGVLWMSDDGAAGGTGYVEAALPTLAECGRQVSALSSSEAQSRFPQIDFAAMHGVDRVYFEEDGGFLYASQACKEVVRAFEGIGGVYRDHAQVMSSSGSRGCDGGHLPFVIDRGDDGNQHVKIALVDGEVLKADAVVFACGPWLNELFPRLFGGGKSSGGSNRGAAIKERAAVDMRVSRQELHYYSPPSWEWLGGLTPWIDTKMNFYGVPDRVRGSFKLGNGEIGPEFVPTLEGKRQPSESSMKHCSEFVAQRFPGLGEEPRVQQSFVCQYTNTPDSHLLVDTHPGTNDMVWLVGGGSGHGFKLGPVVGEHVAHTLLGLQERISLLGLYRAPVNATTGSLFDVR